MRTERKSLKREIARIVGSANVSDSPSQLRKNSSDASGVESSAMLVVHPSNKQEVARVVRLANRLCVPIVPRGGGSGLCGGALAGGGVVLNLDKMSRVIAVNKKRRYVVTQPGIILDQLNERLQRESAFMPVQPASHDLASIGGMVSTNAGGEHVLRFGKMSDNVLGLEVVTGDGRIIRVGGKSIGDFCGTEGIMGIVVEAKLKILPLIRKKSITIRESTDIRELMKMVGRFRKEKSVIACEFINPMLYWMIKRQKKYFLLVEYSDDEGEIKDEKSIRSYWKIREGCNPLLVRRGWGVNGDPWIPLGKIGALLAWCEKEGTPAFGHIGHGVIHIHLRGKAKIGKMYKLVQKLGGSVSGEHGIGVTKRMYLGSSTKSQLKKIKRKYDPNNILNIGKVV